MRAEEDVYETVEPGVVRRTTDARHRGAPAAEEQPELLEETATDPMAVAEEIETGSDGRFEPDRCDGSAR